MRHIAANILSVCLLIGSCLSSCNVDSNYREMVDLGSGEWRYCLEDRSEIYFDQNSISRSASEQGEVITFTIDAPDVKVLKILLPSDVNEVVYRVESSTDNFKSSVITHHDSSKCVITAKEFVSTVDDKAGSVGFVNSVSSTYVECFVDSSEPYWRISILEAYAADKSVCERSIVGVELFDIISLDKSEVTKLGYNDSKWSVTGIPHCYNDMDTYLNISNAEAHIWQGDAWYRRRFYISEEDRGKRFILEFQGVSIAAAVYVNGVPFVGNSKVQQLDDVTNVGCSLPFSLDITDCVKFGQDNILAVRVSNASNSFYTYPEFGVYTGFGMGWGGINAPVYMHILNPVHVAPNVYSIDGDRGVYVATIAADDTSATIRADIEVCNDSHDATRGELVAKVFDANDNLVVEKSSSFDIAAQDSDIMQLSFEVSNPILWYPNNSPYGTPQLYRIESSVFLDKQLLDISSTYFGIRTVEWDEDYCYVNGKRHFLRGFGYRNIYPALGSAVPDAIQWRDVKYMADCGANTLRVGHIPATSTMLEACDRYGIMVIQNSGDNEWVLQGEPINTYKYEYDSQMIISQRNHPSIIVWESNNGIAKGDDDIYGPERTLAAARNYDYLSPRIIHNRDCYPSQTDWNPDDRVMVGYTNRYEKVEGSPSINTEVYGAVWNGDRSQCAARFDFENEKQLAKWYVQDYVDDVKDRACGWIDWMLAETQGEGYTIYLNGMHHQKSLGSSSMDGNRFPKLKYRVYQSALWYEFNQRPGVALQTNWNLEGIVEVDAWSNCPMVELFVGDKSYGCQVPDSLTKHVVWSRVEASDSELRAVGYDKQHRVVCEDIRHRASEPYAVELSIEEAISHPGGRSFDVRANGSDAMLITAKIVDKDGILCNLSDADITFEVSGEGIYRGSYNFYVNDGEVLGYHAPGDAELQAEGGLMKVAVRSTLKAGRVTVRAHSDGLKSGKVTYATIKM